MELVALQAVDVVLIGVGSAFFGRNFFVQGAVEIAETLQGVILKMHVTLQAWGV